MLCQTNDQNRSSLSVSLNSLYRMDATIASVENVAVLLGDTSHLVGFLMSFGSMCCHFRELLAPICSAPFQ